jgi:hypothetical protein
MITHIATVAVYGEDQEEAEQFWTQRSGRKRVSFERFTLSLVSPIMCTKLERVC